MVKKFLAITFVAFVSLLITVDNAVAMVFSQPQKMGAVWGTPIGGIVIEGASLNNGEIYRMNDGKTIPKKKYNNVDVYSKGVAKFGAGADAIYVHYETVPQHIAMFGNKDGKNVFNYEIFEIWYEIRQIKTDNDLVLYALANLTSSNWIILGRKSDGVFVKYLETDDIRRKYFDKPRYVNFDEICTKGDTMIIRYKYFANKNEQRGEFRFKWDDAAQWFGVEQVVY